MALFDCNVLHDTALVTRGVLARPSVLRTQREYKAPTYSSICQPSVGSCAASWNSRRCRCHTPLRDVTCRVTASRKSAGGTVAFFIVTRSSTTSRHAHKDVTHAGPRPKQPLAPRPKQPVAPRSFGWNILRRSIWMLPALLRSQSARRCGEAHACMTKLVGKQTRHHCA